MTIYLTELTNKCNTAKYSLRRLPFLTVGFEKIKVKNKKNRKSDEGSMKAIEIPNKSTRFFVYSVIHIIEKFREN